jgi:uncharacterized membrane protein
VCLVALLLAGYLTWQKLTGRINDLAGCGGSGGCGEILGGRWANWLRVPISVWAIAVYLPLLTLGILGLTSRGRRRLALMGTSVLLVAACWFLFVQAVIAQHFCVYCCLMHACGLVAFACVSWQILRADIRERAAAFFVASIAATLTMVALVTGQVFGPQPDSLEITQEHDLEAIGDTGRPVPQPLGTPATNDTVTRPATDRPTAASPIPPAVPTQPAAEKVDPLAALPGQRVVSFFNGAIQLPVESVPLIGKAAARHIMVKYFDYTCPACRTMHRDLAAAMLAYPDDLAVIVIPCPLNHSCNPHAVQNPSARLAEMHKDACELARLALTVWRADRTKFARFHDELFARQGRMSAKAAATIADSWVGQQQLQSATSDPWIDALLQHSVAVYGRLKQRNPQMPKLLLGGTKVMHGIAKDSGSLKQVLQQQFQLGPASK